MKRLLTEHRILYYHVVSEPFPEIYPLGISLKRFENQLSMLKRLGYTFMPLSLVTDSAKLTKGKTVSITLDDGFACNFSSLKQLCDKYRLKPTLFMIGKCIDNNALAWNHQLLIIKNRIAKQKLDGLIADIMPGASTMTFFSRMKMHRKEELMDKLWSAVMPFSQAEYIANEKPFLTTAQLLELVDCGIEISSHSFSHPDFSRLSPEQTIDELTASFAEFDSRNIPYLRTLSYPYGIPCSASTEAKLVKQMNLSATFAARYTLEDNTGSQIRYKRQLMEGSPIDNLLEFGIKPILRSIKDHLS
jgi:peptidoglycan/xylan/chitin deacetylase (PgdA/CDA1 family)